MTMSAPPPFPPPAPFPPVAAPAPATSSQSGVQLARARWAEARIKELPKLCLCLWNLLLDQHLPARFQEDVFATLAYVLEGGEMIPPDDEQLRGIDELNFAAHCTTQLVARLPSGLFDIHEQILLREGINARDMVREAPHMLGNFHTALRPIYQAKVDKRAPLVKNAAKRNELLKILVGFVGGFKPAPWPQDRLAAVQAFLVSFALPGPVPPPLPPMAGGPPR